MIVRMEFLAVCRIVVMLIMMIGETVSLKEEDHILILNRETFDEAASIYDHIIVEFFAPGCEYCKAFEPEFKRAAKLLKDLGSRVRMAKVDATDEPELSEVHQVRGYPTLKFVRRSRVSDYTGGRTAEEMIAWVNKRTKEPVVKIQTITAAKAAIAQQEVTFVGFFLNENSNSRKAYIDVISELEGDVYLTSSTPAVLTEYKITEDAITVFKKSEEIRTDLRGDLTYDEIRKFVVNHRIPAIIEFSRETSHKIFGGNVRGQMLLFISKTNRKFKDYLDIFRSVALQFKEKVLFIFVDIDEDDNQNILHYFGINPKDCPTYRFVNMAEDMIKYKPGRGDLFTIASLKQFVLDILDGKRKRDYTSLELPKDWNSKPVKVLVGKNFNQVTRDLKKDVLVKFYAPWCSHCQELAPMWRELGERYKDNPHVVVAEIDSTANELSDMRVQGFPTVKLFPRNSYEVIDYNGRMTLSALTRFLDSGGMDSGKSAQGDSEHYESNKEEL